VVVWIHGGAYSFGSSAQPDFDGTELARAGLVMVTLNYRLGFEGFGHVPGRPDNRGLLDQLAALRWVRDNIAAFGGDPGNVTVAGQSAGATSAACLATMDGARGLFRRAVLLSAVGPCYSAELAEATAREVAAEVEAAAGVPLTAASPGALVAASDRVSERCGQDPAAGMRYHDPVLYGPVVDGMTLPEDPVDGLVAGRADGIDLLVCHTTQEYRHPAAGPGPGAAGRAPRGLPRPDAGRHAHRPLPRGARRPGVHAVRPAAGRRP
jgi:para-nitrobenzyl esterase